MSRFKLFYEGDGSDEAVAIDKILKIKRWSEQWPMNYKWLYSDKSLMDALRTVYSNPSYVTSPVVFAENYVADHNFQIEYQYETKQNAGIRGQHTLIIEYPISNLMRTINSGQYNFMHKFYTRLADFQMLLSMHDDEVFLYLDKMNFNDVKKIKLDEIQQYFTAHRRIAQIPNPYEIKDVLTAFEELGVPKAEIIRMKMKFGLPVRPDEIDDKTLVDLL